MTDERRSPDELAPEERQALAAWPAAEPPADLAAQVLTRLAAQPSARRRRLPLVLGLAAALLLAAAVPLWLLRPWRAPATSDVVVAGRTTLDVGGRAAAVAEAGTDLSWRVARGGSARVQQRSGNVFYRVEHGGAFEVETPRGTVRVLGTCFRVEVIEMRPSRAHLTGAGVGAALATVVLVSVYEGRVLTASPVGKAELGAGQSAQLEGGRPRLVDEREARGTRASATAPPASGPASRAELQERNAQLAREAQRLREQVQSLQSQVQKISGDARSTRTFDLTKEELTAMASRCELRWDTPSLDSEAPKVPDKTRKELGLNATERAAVDKVLAENHQQMTTQLRQLYIDVTADRKGADSLSPESLKREIEDKSSRDNLKAVYQRLARERAGLQSPPADLSTSSPLERLYRLLTGMGDRLEQTIGSQIGPDLAHRYREAGLGSRYRSSYGCP